MTRRCPGGVDGDHPVVGRIRDDDELVADADTGRRIEVVRAGPGDSGSSHQRLCAVAVQQHHAVSSGVNNEDPAFVGLYRVWRRDRYATDPAEGC